MTPENKIVKSERTEVVKELPVQQVRSYVDDDGTKVNLVTTEEALTEILNKK